jgi:P27 family predicted phage terminase small subunit
MGYDRIGRQRRDSSGAGRNGLPSKDTGARTGRPLSVDPPKHLRKAGKEWYQRAVTLAVEMGIADEADQWTFESAAEAVDEMKRAQAYIRKYGEITRGVDMQGNIVHRRNPAVGQVHRCREVLRQFRSDLGLSPAARAKFATPAGGEVDPFEELFARQ